MARKTERKLLLACMLFAFVCLLASGGWRLVEGYGDEPLAAVRPDAYVRAALSAAPAQQSQTLTPARRDMSMQRMHAAPALQDRILNICVQSDSNGNVLAAGTYMRAVYQAFALDDGFV